MDTIQKPALVLLPNLLGPDLHHSVFFPSTVDQAVLQLDGMIAESLQGGRSFLNRFRTKKPPHQIPIAVLQDNTDKEEIDFFLKPIVEGQRWGLVSDAGIPCIADPGAKVVYRARQLGISIEAHMGPSSVILALMLSGLPAQRFAFHGYLAREPQGREKEIIALEKQSRQNFATQLFIEAPYRNKYTLQALVDTLQDTTHLCVAWDLTLPTQKVVCQKVASLKKSPLPNLEKKPAIFLIYSGSDLCYTSS